MRPPSPALLTLVLLTASCEDACWKDDYSFVWYGDNVTVYGYDLDESDACAGSFETLDTHTRAVMDLLGVEDSSYNDYRWMSDDFWQGLCPPNVRACTKEGEPHTRALPDMHEVVHMVAYQMPNHGCPSLLEEGLGGYLSVPRPWQANPAPHVDVAALLTDDPIPPTVDAHIRAGHFVSFLIERYGAYAVVRLCELIPEDSTLPDWQSAVYRTLDTSLEQLLADYETYPICSNQQFRARLWECEGEPDFSFSPTDRNYSVEADCSDERATNSAWGSIVITRRVYVPIDTWIGVRAYTDGKRAKVVTQQCAPCSADPQVILEPDGLHDRYRAGMHEVILFLDPEQGDSIELYMGAFP